MSGAALGITVAYVALAVLLLSLNVYSRWPAWVKLSAVVVTGALYYVTYASFEGLKGWPVKAALPEKFVMLSGYVEEPDKRTGSAGQVYLWTLSLGEDHASDTPRAYRLPYSPRLHKEVGDAGKRLRRGVAQIGRVEETRTRLQPGEQTWLDERSERIVIYDLHDPELPEK